MSSGDSGGPSSPPPGVPPQAVRQSANSKASIDIHTRFISLHTLTSSFPVCSYLHDDTSFLSVFVSLRSTMVSFYRVPLFAPYRSG